MKNNIFDTYAWIDIIEPATPATSYSLSAYLAIIVFSAIILVATEKYFNLRIKLRFLQLSRSIKKSNYSHEQIKQLLKLFNIEKNTTTHHFSSKNINQTEIKAHRKILLNAYYSDSPIDLIMLNKTLKTLWQWL